MKKLCFPLHKMGENFQQRSELTWQMILKAALAELKMNVSVNAFRVIQGETVAEPEVFQER